MSNPVPYLSFDGRCRDAVRFYEQALGARIEVLMTNGEAPASACCTPGSADRILHARLVLPGGGTLMAGDCPQHMQYTGIHGVGLTLSYDTVAEAQRVFAALADGGTVTMPMQPSFWARSFGMLVDKFGTPWLVNGELLPL